VSGKRYHLAAILLLGALLVVWWGGLAWLIWYLMFACGDENVAVVERIGSNRADRHSGVVRP
jgi:hypothetical protein